jgi:hypothetical protein
MDHPVTAGALGDWLAARRSRTDRHEKERRAMTEETSLAIEDPEATDEEETGEEEDVEEAPADEAAEGAG